MTSTDPLFAVVMPTKQESAVVARSLAHLRSVRESSGLVFETIVVDGESGDDTAELAAALADRVIIEPPYAPGAIAHARNTGAAASRAPFIFHTDADVIAPDLPGLLARALRAFEDPAVVAVTAAVMPYPWSATRRDRVFHRAGNAYFRMCARLGVFFARGECQVVRRSAFEAVGGYDVNFVSGEDCDLFQRLHRIGRIVYLRDFSVYHSPRRFHQMGYARVLGIYVREWLWMTILRKSYVEQWQVVR
jgi:glycosyltransferase involved in cell wall biosynthesis